MRRVYISAFGSGLGHASRMLALADELRRREFRVLFSSSGEAAELVRKRGYQCGSIPLVDVSWKDDGRFSPVATSRNFPLMAARFVKQVGIEASRVAQFDPDVVISDSMLSAVLASRLTGTKVVTILNQIRLDVSSSITNMITRLISFGSLSLGGTLWSLSEKVLLPDLPPPYTISARNLWVTGDLAVKCKYIGFLMPQEIHGGDDVTRKLEREERLKVYWQISGPPATRRALLASAFRLAKAQAGRVVSIISAGIPSGRTDAVETEFGWYYEWSNVKDSLMRMADVVVSRAGHTSIAQFIRLRKPSVLVPIPFQTEQEGNASTAERLGISVRLDQKDLSSANFEEALANVCGGDVARRLSSLGAVAERYDPISEVVTAIG